MESTKIPTVFVAYHIATKGFAESKNAVCSKDRILACKTFSSEKIIGSFFSCVYHGQLRFHVIFNEESNLFDDEIIELVHQSIDGSLAGLYWNVGTEHGKITCIGKRKTEKRSSGLTIYCVTLSETHLVALASQSVRGHTTKPERSCQHKERHDAIERAWRFYASTMLFTMVVS